MIPFRWGEDCAPACSFLTGSDCNITHKYSTNFCYHIGYEQAVMNDVIASFTVGRPLFLHSLEHMAELHKLPHPEPKPSPLVPSGAGVDGRIQTKLDWFMQAHGRIFKGFLKGAGCGGDAISVLPKARGRGKATEQVSPI